MVKRARYFFAGFFMGIAELIPGISGSTVALLFGIYKNLIQILSELKVNKDTFTLDYLQNKIQISLVIFLIIPMIASLILFSENTFAAHCSGGHKEIKETSETSEEDTKETTSN